MITAGNRGYGAWRDGGFTIHDLSDPRAARSCSRTSTGRRRSPAARTRRCRCRAATCAVVADEANAEKCAKGTFHTFDRRRARAGEPGADRDAADAAGARLLRRSARSARTTCTRTGPGRFQSEETIFATYNNAGVRVFDIKRRVRAEGDRVLGAADAGAG